MARRILITGGAGFVGFHLARTLSERSPDAEIVVLDDFSRGSLDAELEQLRDGASVELMTGDVTDPATWDSLGGGYDHVYHLAAIVGVKHVLGRPVDVLRVNALATMHMLEWLVRGGGDKVLFSSTSEIYAWTQRYYPLPVPTPEDVPLSLTEIANPRSSYAGSKLFGELAVTQYCNQHAHRFAIVRYHNVYGPRMGTDHVIPELFKRARDGEDPLAVYSPDHRRSFCYVSDAVDATIAAMESERADGETLNVGNDSEEITILSLAERLVEQAGLSVTLQPTPTDDPIKRRSPDITRAREVLGYEPRVDLATGLAKTLAWYAERLEAGGAQVRS